MCELNCLCRFQTICITDGGNLIKVEVSIKIRGHYLISSVNCCGNLKCGWFILLVQIMERAGKVNKGFKAILVQRGEKNWELLVLLYGRFVKHLLVFLRWDENPDKGCHCVGWWLLVPLFFSRKLSSFCVVGGFCWDARDVCLATALSSGGACTNNSLVFQILVMLSCSCKSNWKG